MIHCIVNHGNSGHSGGRSDSGKYGRRKRHLALGRGLKPFENPIYLFCSVHSNE